jgi:spoIIIJ-associated protein
MTKSIETQAKTIEAAIEDALSQLGASYDEVDVDIIQEPGFLKKAKVRATLKEKEKEVAKPIEKPTPLKQEKPVIARTQSEAKETKQSSKPAKKEEKKDVTGKASTEVKEVKKEVKAEEKPEKKEVKKEKPVQTGDMPAKFEKTLTFATKLIELLGSDAQVTHETTDKSFNINVNGNGGAGVGQIIGKGGEVMNAIQTLVSSIAIANSAGEQKRVYFNVEDYKERRTETLKALAVRKAEKVKETGRFIKLEPMNSRERAIIHSALQEIQGIRTYSTGKDPYRCLCIAPARKDD